MTVLLYNRDPSLWAGGDMVQLLNTMQALEDLGVEISFTSNPDTDFEPYDIVHSFHVNFDWSLPPVAHRMQLKKPYVLSSIFYPVDYGVPFKAIGKMVDHSKATIALSEKEKDELVTLCGASKEKIRVIPNGVDTDLWQRGRTKGGPAITFARVIPTKGLLTAAIACKRLSIPYLVYGATGSDPAYERLLMANGATLMGYLQPDMLAYEATKAGLYICSSISERQSLGVLEAAAIGLPIVDSIHNRGASLLPSSVVVDPNDEKALEEAIEQQSSAPDNTDYVPSWKEVATKILAFYAA